MRECLLAAVAVLLVAPLSAQGFEPRSGSLHDANTAFHVDYNALQAKTLRSFGTPGRPVVVRLDDDLIVLHGGTRTVARILPPLYHSLKAVSHVPFGLYLALTAEGEGPLAPETRAGLQAERARAVAALAGLKEQFPRALRDRQSRILKGSVACVDAVLKSGSVSRAEVRGCSRALAPLLEADVADAARLELDGLDEEMRRLKDGLSDAEWRALLVVVCSSHQPRHRNVSLQYFLRLLGEEEGPGAQAERRVVYAEGVFDEGKALNLLAKHVLDRDAAEAFFGDPDRLQRDLLGDAAAARLDAISRTAR